MSYRIWAEAFSHGDLSTTRVWHPFVPDNSIVFKGCKIDILVMGDPTFTSLNMKIYSNSVDNTPGKLLATSSNSVLKSEILTTEDNAVANIFFEFENSGAQGFLMRGGERYNMVLNGSGASGFSSAVLIAWKKAWPDPQIGSAAWNDLVKTGYSFISVTADI